MLQTHIIICSNLTCLTVTSVGHRVKNRDPRTYNVSSKMLPKFHRAPFPVHFEPATKECPCSAGRACQGYGAGRVRGSLTCSRSYFRKRSSLGHKALGKCPLSPILRGNGGENASGKFLGIMRSDTLVFPSLLTTQAVKSNWSDSQG